MKKDSIIAKAYDLLKFSIPPINRLPRNYKFTFGDRVQNQLADLLELLIEAYYSPQAKKKILLFQANIKLEKLRYYFRLGYDLGLYSSTHYQEFAARLQEIGRMLGGWLKHIS